jgi:hypothetical protein
MSSDLIIALCFLAPAGLGWGILMAFLPKIWSDLK